MSAFGTIKTPDAGLASGVSFSDVSKHIHLHGFDRFCFSVNEQAHLLGCFAAENLLAAAQVDIDKGAIFPYNIYNMKIPNAEQAVVDIRKLRDYCLNPEHDEGKHKARLFAAVFEMTSADAEDLREALLEAVKSDLAHLSRRDEFGQRYVVEFMFEWHNKRAMVRSGWIIEHHSDTPKLTTCFPI